MTLEIERDALLGALRQVADVVEGRTTIPILANLLLQSDGGRLTVTGTNLDIQATARAEAAGELSTTVDASKLLAAVTSMKAGRLTIEPAAGRAAITIKQKRGVRTLPTLPATDFPKRAALESSTAFAIGGASLLRILDCAHVAQSTDESRYYLIGIYLHTQGDQLVGAATDGHRLVVVRVPLPDGAEAMPAIIVPTKCVTLLRKLLAKVDAEVSISVNSKAISFTVGDAQILANLIDGTYPDYARVVPSSDEHVVVLGREALIGPVTAVAAVVNAEGDKKVRTVVLELGKPDECQVTAKDQGGASAAEPLECDFTGGSIRLGLNHRYLTSLASIFADGGRLTMAFHDAAAPVRVTSDKDPDLTAVIMPMRA